MKKPFGILAKSIFGLITVAAAGTATAQTHVGDVTIDGSLCAGTDCAPGESFGFDTLRIKENNLRFNFDDTSNSASFPANDWRIVINDTSNGGANYFAVEDATAVQQIFKLSAGAPVFLCGTPQTAPRYPSGLSQARLAALSTSIETIMWVSAQVTPYTTSTFAALMRSRSA